MNDLNNLNEPQDGNIIPTRHGDGNGDGGKWKYVPFVSVVGFAALGWIWSKQFQNKIQETKVEILDSQKQKPEEEHHHMRLEIAKKISGEFQNSLANEKKQEQSALKVLNEVEHRLMERQWEYCSNLRSIRPRKDELEKDLLDYTARQPRLAGLNMQEGLRDIFNNDQTCGERFNTDKRKNGSLMWLYLRYWKLQLTLQSHQKAEMAIILNAQKKE